jgi:hypothetical protein
VYPFSNSYQSVDVNAIIYIAFTSFQCQLLSVSTSFLKMNLNSSCCFDLYRCVGDKPSTNRDLKYLKYCIKIEKTTIIDLSSTQKKEYIYKKWLPLETVLRDWNFSLVLQKSCSEKFISIVCVIIVHTCRISFCIDLFLLFHKQKYPQN